MVAREERMVTPSNTTVSILISSNADRRADPPPVHTYQPYSPTGLDLKLLKRALKEPPKIPLEWSPGALVLGLLRGQFREL